MLSVKCLKKGQSIIVAICGEATLRYAEKMKKQLIAISRRDFSNVEIDLSETTDMDLHFLQVLLSFCQTVRKNGRGAGLSSLSSDNPVGVFMSGIGITSENFSGE